MSIAFEPGAHRFKSLRLEHGRLVHRQCRSAYCAVPASAVERKLLQSAGIRFAESGDSHVVVGDAAVELARLFRHPMRSLLPQGHVSRHDPLARQLTASLVDALLPPPQKPNAPCCIALSDSANDPRSVYDAEFFTHLVRLRGYTPTIVSPGMAVVLAVLVDSRFSGLGICMGAERTHISLAHRGIELARWSVDCGSAAIDAAWAEAREEYVWDPSGRRSLDRETARLRKEAFGGSLVSPQDDDAKWLAETVRALLATVLQAIGEGLGSLPHLNDLPRPLDLGCAGGTCLLPGFRRLFEQVAGEARLPLPIGTVRVAEDPSLAVLRGCLIQAELDASYRPRGERAA